MSLSKVLPILGMSAWLVTSNALAGNGANLIGVSPASTALGGTGVSNYTNETDAMHKNPALLGAGASTSSKFTGELSSNFYKLSPTADAGLGGAASSSAGLKVLPNIGASYRWSDKLSIGLGGVTYSGGAVDYTGSSKASQIKMTNATQRVMAVGSYRINDTFSVGVAPFLAYGTLVLNDDFLGGGQSTRESDGRTAVGGQIGATAKLSKDFTFGATFITKTSDLTYKNIVNLGFLAKNPAAAAGGKLNDIIVNQPAEIGAGVTYAISDVLKATADYRYIGWSRTNGFGDLGWQDQHVIALGSQYQSGKAAFRLGFNWAQSPIRDITGESGDSDVNFQGTTVSAAGVSRLNIVAFPAINELHFTGGVNYAFNDAFSADLGFQYAPKKTITRSGTAANAAYSYTVSQTQWSVSAGGAYRF